MASTTTGPACSSLLPTFLVRFKNNKHTTLFASSENDREEAVQMAERLIMCRFALPVLIYAAAAEEAIGGPEQKKAKDSVNIHINSIKFLLLFRL